MFDDDERFTLLMLLWNYRQQATHAVESGGVSVERVEATMRQLDQHDEIVKKLGGDPTKPAFGLNPA
jgi:hypothetical protein